MTNNESNELTALQTNEKRYNLKNDVIFQAFFSRKGNEEFLADFLNGLLGKDIESVEIREEVNLERLSLEEKGGRLDLQAKLGDGTIVSIEMQLRNEYNIEERTTLYSGKVLSRETQRGTDYKDINQVIMVNILDYNFLDVDDYISETAIVLDKHRDYEVLTGLKWYFIELPKFRKQNPDMNEKINQWLAFLDDYDKEAMKVAEEKNEILVKARIQMKYLTGEAELRRLADLREKWEMDRISGINYATRVGREEGAKEKGIEIAKEMLKKGLSVELVCEITKLTKEEVEEIVTLLKKEQSE